MSDDKECFFIAPIGDEGSEIRERSNKLMEYIVEEAVSNYGYSVTRADQMDQPGSITSQIIQMTVNSELVIADLTGHNPNVFYELAVRHATGKPYIQLIESSESIPFDISDLRTIQYGLGVEEADQAREQICSQLESLRDEDPEFDNPISRSAEMQSLRESTDPTDQNLAEILQTISRLDRKVDRLEANMVKSDPKFTQHTSRESTHSFEIDGHKFAIAGDTISRDVISSIAKETDKTSEEVEAIVTSRGIDVTDS